MKGEVVATVDGCRISFTGEEYAVVVAKYSTVRRKMKISLEVRSFPTFEEAVEETSRVG